MANYLSFATVTETVRQVLDAVVSLEVNGAGVKSVRPGTPGGGGPPDKGAGIYLYQVTPNAARRNEELAVRNDAGDVVERPRAAFELHYLFSFYGDETKQEPQRVMGSVLRVLHAHPVLTRKMIKAALVGADWLAGSDLADDIELVRFTPTALTIEELSKLWTVFSPTPHVLSVTYKASVVMLEGTALPRPVLPVKTRNIYVRPFNEPTIDRVLSRAALDQPAIEQQPVLPGYTLVLQGSHLQSDSTVAKFATASVDPQKVSPTQVELVLKEPPFPAGTMRAGLQPVQVVQNVLMGTPGSETPHMGFESNVVALVLHPVIKATSANKARVKLDVNPKLGTGQRAVMVLNGYDPPTLGAFAFDVPPDQAGKANITVPVTGVKNGRYFIRLRVDGAESLLDLDPTSPDFGPTVKVPTL